MDIIKFQSEKYQKHWAENLQVGDRVKGTIRHQTDGSKNKIDVDVIVVANLHNSKIEAHFEGKNYTIPYNELREPKD